MRGAGYEIRDARCGIAALLLLFCASLTSCRDAGLVKD